MLAFTIPGRPVTWQRTGEDKRSGRARVTDHKQRAEKRRIAMLARAALPPGWPTDVEYAIEVIGYWPDRRFGDVDRLVSLTMDALEGVAYHTDRQVADERGGRRLDRERPRVEVSLVPILDGEEVDVTMTIRPASKIDITIGKTPCSAEGGIAKSRVPSRPLAGRKATAPQRANARGQTEPEKEAR